MIKTSCFRFIFLHATVLWALPGRQSCQSPAGHSVFPAGPAPNSGTSADATFPDDPKYMLVSRFFHSSPGNNTAMESQNTNSFKLIYPLFGVKHVFLQTRFSANTFFLYRWIIL